MRAAATRLIGSWRGKGTRRIGDLIYCDMLATHARSVRGCDLEEEESVCLDNRGRNL